MLERYGLNMPKNTGKNSNDFAEIALSFRTRVIFGPRDVDLSDFISEIK
jgi:hypothetical protein